jgi:endonuclease/exonuclease/phosphatase family metal-dependent hydrolase
MVESAMAGNYTAANWARFSDNIGTNFVSSAKTVLSLTLLLLMLSGCMRSVMNWRETVGPNVMTKTTVQPNDGRILVVNWNMHVGHGDIGQLIEDLSAAERENGRGNPDFVFLIEEAFRRGTEIPSRYASGAAVPSRISPPAAAVDIEDIAARLGWSLYYAPSMRNGKQAGEGAEDRGNAILSSLPLSEGQAIELPFVVQRRVALTALVDDARRNRSFRVVVAHLDTTGPLYKGWFFAGPSERNRQAHGLMSALNGLADEHSPIVIGSDLNTNLGPLESADDTISRIAPRQDCNTSRTHQSGLILDHIFARVPGDWGVVPACSRMNSTYGSDHYPLVLPITSSTTD